MPGKYEKPNKPGDPFDRENFLHYALPMATLERKERDRLKRTEEIITAARILFIHKGFTSATMQDIADEAKLGRRTLYMYFKTKEEILFEITRRTTDRILRLVEENEKKGTTGREKLDNIANSFIHFYTNNQEEIIFVLHSDLTMTNEDGEQEPVKHHRYIIDEVCTILERIITLGIQDGTLRKKEESIQLTAFTVISMIIGTMKALSLYSGPLQSSRKNFDFPLILSHSLRILIDSISI